MRTVHSLILLLALVPFAACRREATEQSRQTPSPAPQASAMPGTKSPHANQVSVSLGKTSPEAGRLNPRITEAYSPEKVTLERTAAAPAGFPGAEPPREESPQPGMKWLIVIVELDAIEGEFSLSLNKIHIVDQVKKAYRLVSFGGSEAGTFTDLREYDKYKMVEPPKMIMRSAAASKQSFLFAVASKAEGLSFEF
jgi:hypothetical protein